jgi:hypothetical protein
VSEVPVDLQGVTSLTSNVALGYEPYPYLHQTMGDSWVSYYSLRYFQQCPLERWQRLDYYASEASSECRYAANLPLILDGDAA